jgi:1,4-dihydroxy-2-naphthoyl-CoA hydrolase
VSPDIIYQGSIEFTVTERGPDRVVSEMPIGAGITNPFGVVHAGAMLWFADVTATMLVIGDAKPAEGMTGFPLAVNLAANFIGNQRDGTLTAVAAFVKKGRTVSVVRTEVRGANDRLLADVTTSHVLSK